MAADPEYQEQILDETDALEQIESYGRRLQQGLGEILDRRGVAHVFEGDDGLATGAAVGGALMASKKLGEGGTED